jgi:RNA polymerase sigma-70 factor (ECF subfamily)
MDEKEILKRILLGDKESFGELFLKHQDFIFKIIFGYVKVQEDAEDILSDVFLKAYEKIEDFRGDSKISSWLYRIAYNLSMNWLERKKDRNVDITPEIENSVKEDSYEKIFEKAIISKSLGNVIEGMPDKYKIIIKLYYFEEKSYDEISEILKIPINTVKVHLFRAKKIIEESIK